MISNGMNPNSVVSLIHSARLQSLSASRDPLNLLSGSGALSFVRLQFLQANGAQLISFIAVHQFRALRTSELKDSFECCAERPQQRNSKVQTDTRAKWCASTSATGASCCSDGLRRVPSCRATCRSAGLELTVHL